MIYLLIYLYISMLIMLYQTSNTYTNIQSNYKSTKKSNLTQDTNYMANKVRENNIYKQYIHSIIHIRIIIVIRRHNHHHIRRQIILLPKKDFFNRDPKQESLSGSFSSSGSFYVPDLPEVHTHISVCINICMIIRLLKSP